MIRKALIEDASRIAEMHVFGWRMAYRGIVDDDTLYKRMSVPKRIEGIVKTIEQNTEELYVFEQSGIVKGFMTFGKSRDADKPDAFELCALYVEPSLKRSGVGTRLVRRFEDIGAERGFSEYILWVLEKNIEGRNFYASMGYSPDGKSQMIEKLGVTEIRLSRMLR